MFFLSVIVVLLFLMPLIVQLLLPFGYDSFRIWDSVSRAFINSDKPFYSNINISRVEVGDLAHGTEFEVNRSVTWFTDSRGFRTQESIDDFYDVVILGDSTIAGAGLSQEDMLYSVISNKTGLRVYSMGQVGINRFLSDSRFVLNPPKVLVFGVLERNMNNIDVLNKSVIVRSKYFFPIKERLVDLLDRSLKLNFIRKKISPSISSDNLAVNNSTRMVFYDVSLTQQLTNSFVVTQLVDEISSYNDLLADRNITLIFLPVPNKETVYYDDLPQNFKNRYSKSNFTSHISFLTNNAGVKTVDLLPIYNKEKSQSFLYQLDDTHWNRDGVLIAADEVIKLMNVSDINHSVFKKPIVSDLVFELLVYEAFFLLFVLAFLLRIFDRK